MKKLLTILGLLLLTSCGEGQHIPAPSLVTKAIAYIPITTDTKASTVPMSVVVNSSATFVVDNSAFTSPTNGNVDTLDFGNLEVVDLRDNNLDVCGTGTQKCGTAYLLVYTTGTAGSGLYNSNSGYGLPISSILGGTVNVVGLEQANAAVMQTFTIPANKRVLKLTDFVDTPLYNITVDVSNAGAGTFSTTLVIEYALGF